MKKLFIGATSTWLQYNSHRQKYGNSRRIMFAFPLIDEAFDIL